MTTTLKLFAKRTNELALTVKCKDRWVIGDRGVALVDDVKMIVRINRHSMGDLPMILAGQFWKRMFAAKFKLTLANDTLRSSAFGA